MQIFLKHPQDKGTLELLQLAHNQRAVIVCMSPTRAYEINTEAARRGMAAPQTMLYVDYFNIGRICEPTAYIFDRLDEALALFAAPGSNLRAATMTQSNVEPMVSSIPEVNNATDEFRRLVEEGQKLRQAFDEMTQKMRNYK